MPQAKLSSNEIDVTQPPNRITHRLLASQILPELVAKMVSKGVECRLEVRGYSMSPFVKDNDTVTISPMVDSSPGFGDVIAFVHPGTEKLVIHRVVGKLGNACLVKGENASEPDGLIERKHMIGIITRVERKGRKVLFGLGPERFLIALLTRANLVPPLLRLLRRIFLPITRIFS
jgi:hypothetical protein